MAGHRHSRADILAKLDQADALCAKGKPQREIAAELGVSVMTYHRWRKLRLNLAASSSGAIRLPCLDARNGQRRDIADLELENARLRRLITDLLLEKMESTRDGDGPQ